jgi:hypothetical protein
MAGWTDAANAGGNGGKGGDVILVSSAAVWDFSNLQHHLVKPCPCVIIIKSHVVAAYSFISPDGLLKVQRVIDDVCVCYQCIQPHVLLEKPTTRLRID